MKRLLRYVLLLSVVCFLAEDALAQTQTWKEMHKVTRKETIFGIAKDNGLTIEELIAANPDMNPPGYELKKGDYIFIPWPKGETPKTTNTVKQTVVPQHATPAVSKTIHRIGVMLPLHDDNGDGKRMIEYYRGVLMAVDSLKQMGYNMEIHAWNTPENADMGKILEDPAAAQCELIIGPLYSNQVSELSRFVSRHGIKLLIPYSIIAPEVYSNSNIYQVYQDQAMLNETCIDRFMEKFGNDHVVLIDCNDEDSQKGVFTFGIRRQLENRNNPYSVVNLTTREDMFAKAFSKTKNNVVVLNTGKSPQMLVALEKLNGFRVLNPNVNITLWGYTEWLMYTKYQLDNFYKYNTYVPSTFYYNPLSPQTVRFQQKYRWNFHQDMIESLPRFAITGYDQAFYFIKGLIQQGKGYNGNTTGYQTIQSPLRFERAGNGGMMNRSTMLVHYRPDQTVELLIK